MPDRGPIGVDMNQGRSLSAPIKIALWTAAFHVGRCEKLEEGNDYESRDGVNVSSSWSSAFRRRGASASAVRYLVHQKRRGWHKLQLDYVGTMQGGAIRRNYRKLFSQKAGTA